MNCLKCLNADEADGVMQNLMLKVCECPESSFCCFLWRGMFYKPLEKYLRPTWTILFLFSLSIHWDKAAINPRVNSLSCFFSAFPSISRSISLTQTQASLCALTLTYFWRKKERFLTLDEAFQSFVRWSRTESSACLQLRHDETKLTITQASSISHDLIKRRNPEESTFKKRCHINTNLHCGFITGMCVDPRTERGEA